MLELICIILALLGLMLILLAIVPPTREFVPNGLAAGLGMVIVAVILYVILRLAGVA